MPVEEPSTASKADSCTATNELHRCNDLLDDLVGETNQREWNGQPERLCGLEVEEECVLVRALDGQVGRLLALEDAIDLTCRLPILVDHVDDDAVGYQTAGLGEFRLCRDRRQVMTVCQVGDQLLVQIGEGIGRQDQPAARSTREALEGWFDVGGGANGDDNQLHAERRRSGFDRAHEEFGLWRRVGVEHDGNAREAGRDFLEQIEPFATDRELGPAETGEVAARLRHGRNEALCDWIGDQHEYDRDCAGGLPDDLQINRVEAGITSGISPINWAA